MITLIVRANRAIALCWKGSVMLRKSSRSTREAIVTPVSALIMASAGSVLSAPYEARAIKSIELQASQDIFLFFHAPARWQLSRARGDSADQKSSGGEVGRRNG